MPDESAPDPTKLNTSSPSHESTIDPQKGAPSSIVTSLGDSLFDATAIGRASSGEPPSIAGYRILRRNERVRTGPDEKTEQKGGQAIVYQAVQESTNRLVIIKLLRPDRLGPFSEAYFRQEIELEAKLRHSNIVLVFDSGTTADGRRWVVMDYVPGEPFHRYVSQNRLSVLATLRLFHKISAAVAYVHEKDIVHCDLKPLNVLVESNGTPKVLDFGLARTLTSPLDEVLPMAGEVLGSPQYMSPEQTRGVFKEIGKQTDVFALGTMLFEVLTGCLPYPISFSVEERRKHFRELQPRALRDAWKGMRGFTFQPTSGNSIVGCPIDDDLESIVSKTLQIDPSRRYASAAELTRDIDHYLRVEPIEARANQRLYVGRIHLCRWALRHRVLSLLGVLTVAVLVTMMIAIPLFFQWTSVNNRFQRALLQSFPLSPAGTDLEYVRIIGWTDRTDRSVLGRMFGLDESTMKQPGATRLAAGKLMERLARSGCRVVAWDAEFPEVDAKEFDDAFVLGVNALRDAGIDTVIGAMQWWFPESPAGNMSRRIGSEVRWGGIMADFGKDAPWTLPLTVQRGVTASLPSLALETFAAYRRPNAIARITLNEEGEFLDLFYEAVEGSNRLVDRFQSGTDRVILSLIRAAGEQMTPRECRQFGLQPTDSLGLILVPMPADSVLQAPVIEFTEALASTEEQLRTWFDGKVVIVGNLVNPSDQFEHPDGRLLPGALGHAVGVNQLLKGGAITLPRWWEERAYPVLGAGIGCMLAVWTTRRRMLRYLTGLGLIVILSAASVLVFGTFHYLVNPMVSIFALCLGCGIQMKLQRFYDGRLAG